MRRATRVVPGLVLLAWAGHAAAFGSAIGARLQPLDRFLQDAERAIDVIRETNHAGADALAHDVLELRTQWFGETYEPPATTAEEIHLVCARADGRLPDTGPRKVRTTYQGGAVRLLLFASTDKVTWQLSRTDDARIDRVFVVNRAIDDVRGVPSETISRVDLAEEGVRLLQATCESADVHGPGDAVARATHGVLTTAQAFGVDIRANNEVVVGPDSPTWRAQHLLSRNGELERAVSRVLADAPSPVPARQFVAVLPSGIGLPAVGRATTKGFMSGMPEKVRAADVLAVAPSSGFPFVAQLAPAPEGVTRICCPPGSDVCYGLRSKASTDSTEIVRFGLHGTDVAIVRPRNLDRFQLLGRSLLGKPLGIVCDGSRLGVVIVSHGELAEARWNERHTEIEQRKGLWRFEYDGATDLLTLSGELRLQEPWPALLGLAYDATGRRTYLTTPAEILVFGPDGTRESTLRLPASGGSDATCTADQVFFTDGRLIVLRGQTLCGGGSRSTGYADSPLAVFVLNASSGALEYSGRITPPVLATHVSTLISAAMGSLTSGLVVFVVVALIAVQGRRKARVHAEELEVKTRVSEEQAEALRAKEAEREQYAHVISHDVRGPIAAVGEALRLIKEGGAAEADGLHSVATAGIRKADRLLWGLLQLMRGATTEERSLIPLHELVSGLADEARATVPAGAIRIDVVTRLPDVVGRPTVLASAFRNVIENGVRHTAGQPGAAIEIGHEPAGDDVAIWIRDNGDGIPAGWEGRIFERFKRAPNARGDGSGHGLALVKQIIEEHGGEVWAESEGVGHGSTFWITLPLPHDGDRR